MFVLETLPARWSNMRLSVNFPQIPHVHDHLQPKDLLAGSEYIHPDTQTVEICWSWGTLCLEALQSAW